METITTSTFYHRQKLCIGLHFKQHAKLQQQLQQKLQARWSSTHKCWYCEKTEKHISYLENELGVYLSPALVTVEKELKAVVKKEVVVKKTADTPPLKKPETKQKKFVLSKENKNHLQEFVQLLHLKSYSESTQRTYAGEFTQFLNILGKNNATELPVSRIKDYLEYCSINLGLSENSLHSRMNALKFFF